MTEVEAGQLIAQRFVEVWPIESGGGVPFMFDNESAVTGDAFASLSIRFTTGRGQTTAGRPGNRRFERTGQIYVRIWTPTNQGSAGGSALCDAARRVLEGIDLSVAAGGEPVTIESGDTQPPMTDGRWWMSTVIFRLRYAERR